MTSKVNELHIAKIEKDHELITCSQACVCRQDYIAHSLKITNERIKACDKSLKVMETSLNKMVLASTSWRDHQFKKYQGESGLKLDGYISIKEPIYALLLEYNLTPIQTSSSDAVNILETSEGRPKRPNHATRTPKYRPENPVSGTISKIEFASPTTRDALRTSPECQEHAPKNRCLLVWKINIPVTRLEEWRNMCASVLASVNTVHCKNEAKVEEPDEETSTNCEEIAQM